MALIHRNNVDIQPVRLHQFLAHVVRTPSPTPDFVQTLCDDRQRVSSTRQIARDILSMSFKMSSRPSQHQPPIVLLICGDFNAPGKDDCTINQGLDDVLETLGLEQHVLSPTRASPDHLLDLIISDQPSNIREVRVIDSGAVSDHQLIVASLDIGPVEFITTSCHVHVPSN